ncbi:MAG: hypothetical protein WCW40_04775 [Bacteroidota bacterium]
MRSIFAALLAAILVVGCDQSNPIDSSASGTQGEAMFSELSMAKTAHATLVLEDASTDNETCPHDSLRNHHMLDSLKAHLSLTESQFDTVKVFAATLISTLHDIRSQVEAKTITRDSARVLVKAARDLFVLSVKSILTAQQTSLFETWLMRYWNRPPHHRHGHGRPGGHGGPGGGHGGPGEDGGHHDEAEGHGG